VFWYLGSVICAVLAMKTKEIAFMIPVMLTLYEFIFFRGKIKKRVLYLIPFIITMLIIPLTLLNIDKPTGEMIGDFDKLIKRSSELSKGEYLITEFRVLVTYLRLIFLPVNQNLDYDYPRSLYILFRYRDSAPHTRLISFGIIWFFINLLIESSIVGLNNVIFEHRVYLPSIGIFSALTVAIFMAIHRWKQYAKVITVMLAVIIIALTGATYARNSVWKNELTLWQDVINKSPNKAGVHFNLANIFQMQGLNDNAITYYQNAIIINPAYSNAYNNLGYVYASQGLIDKAIEQYLMAIRSNPYYTDPYINLGDAYLSQGDADKAIEQCLLALKYKSDYPEAHLNLGSAYETKGLLDKAINEYLLALKYKPDYPEAHLNLGSAYQTIGLLDKAINEYLLALKYKPDYPEAHYNLGTAYKSQGEIDLAIRAYNNALRLRPGWELPRKKLDQLRKERLSGES
jgi:tetratricopeptide (TPR) repeat protein